ncbi:thiosulfate sulfurtransferase [Saccharomycopsis crataegensis]|uniref:Thiosulfate sulfurtransferase n=1 Tax=Saccharomycopsis crataegensis TaxID=43959 RepID=A0AAV5QT71_9ASCO|nr:thiosulfate sulfurtransferase [Saccharomycopsis crataegensis]
MSRTNIKVITPSKLNSLLKTASSESRIVPVDATWYMPNQKKLGFDTFKASRIPNSIFIDIDKIKDEKSSYPHMLPSSDIFKYHVSKLGIRNNDHLVVYDQIGNFSAPRAAWMFEVFRHKNIYLLDNYQSYLKEKYDIDSSPIDKPSTYPESDYEMERTILNDVVSFEEIYDIVSDPANSSKYHILDARSTGRYKGVDPEPRPGLTSGHAPHVISSPATEVLQPGDKTFLPKEDLIEFFNNRKVDNSKPIIVMCGTGVTACIIKSALEISGLGEKGIQVYDGSWTEYAQRADPKYIIKE